MNAVIGIISYLPDNDEIKNKRFKLLVNLLTSCHKLFDLPIIIIAQNWESELIRVPWVTIYRYTEKLGITGARKALRKTFLESDYDYLIMLDDDCVLSGNSGKEYLKQIEDNPDCFIEFNKTLLKLFAISKTLFKQVDYDDLSPENGEGFEDRLFVNTLRKKFPELRREFKNTGIQQHSESTADPLSTWYQNQDLKTMLENTENKLKEIK